MGRQINFFMMPEDVAELEQYIKELGLLLVAEKMPDKTPTLLNKLVIDNNLKTYLVSPQNLNKLKIEYSEPQKTYYIMPIQSPVIEFRKPVFVGSEKKMNKGRLYFADSILNDNNEIINIDTDTIKSADKIFKWTKKHFKDVKINSWFTTERTYQWAISNNVVLSEN